ncbi:MAG: phosphate acetyltransferase [Nitrospirae bacterium]|nr:phosphate acetyltransferase [Nitrospirota bacterium]
MCQGLYVMSEEPESGKSAMLLGMMELVSRTTRKAGFFKPLVDSRQEHDPIIDLIAGRYDVRLPYESLFGCTVETAREMITAERYEDLLALILGKYNALATLCDVILCTGTDFTGNTPLPLEFDFNADVANNLGCLVIAVAKGFGRSAEQVVEAAGAFSESLKKRRCDVLAFVVNRVDRDLVPLVKGRLPSALTPGTPFFVVPETDILGRPTVGEIARALNATLISGDSEGLEGTVADYKVAAMELPHFLDYLEEGSLIITPGDRSDIILGSLLADASGTYPHIAGIILTGHIMPAPQVKRLIEGLRKYSVPVLSVAADTFTTALQVSGVKSGITPENKRKIAAALGTLEASVNFAELGRRIAVTHSTRVTPLMFEYKLIGQARSDRRHIVLPEGTEERILRAAEILLLRDVVDITFLGNPDEVREKIRALGLSIAEPKVLDPSTSELREPFAAAYYELRKHKGITIEMARDTLADVSYFGTMLVHSGHADGMVSGAVHTTRHTIRPALEFIKTKPGCSIVSSVFFMCLEDHVAVFGDCAVNPDPSAEQLADIAISSAETASMFGIQPLVAMLSYSTGESGMGVEVDKVREATRIAKRLRPDLKIEGPIQYDAAVDMSVARSKMPGSEVAGHATVFVFPDLNTGNNTYKAVQRSANAVAIGPVMQGLKKPVNDLSRGATVTDIVNTVAITAIQAQRKEGTE